jgi:hypothetical protein
MGLVLMVEWALTNEDMGNGHAAGTIPDDEPEFENLPSI